MGVTLPSQDVSGEALGSPQFWQLLRSRPEELARKVCQIDLVNLEQTLQRQPALRAWINAAYETAKIAEEKAKWHLAKVKAQAHLQSSKEGKKTVAQLEAEIQVDPTVEAAFQEFISASETKGVLRAMSDALEDRLQMLIQIAAKHRQEQNEYNKKP